MRSLTKQQKISYKITSFHPFFGNHFEKVDAYKHKHYDSEYHFHFTNIQKRILRLSLIQALSLDPGPVCVFIHSSTITAFGRKVNYCSHICANPRNWVFKPLTSELKISLDQRLGMVCLDLSSSCTIGTKYFLCCVENCELGSMTNILLIKHPLTLSRSCQVKISESKGTLILQLFCSEHLVFWFLGKFAFLQYEWVLPSTEMISTNNNNWAIMQGEHLNMDGFSALAL